MPQNARLDKKTIGLIGLYRCGNLGDEAIWQAFVQELISMLDTETKIRMVTFGPGGFESADIPRNMEKADGILHRLALDDPGARRINWSFWIGQGAGCFLKMLSSFSAVWYAGGHWLHDISKTTLAGVMLPILWARYKGGNAGFVNVGAGPLDSFFGRRLVALSTKANGPLIVRDEYSADILEKASIHRKAIVARDTAFLLEPPSDEAIDRAWKTFNRKVGARTIGIVPCAWFKMADLYNTRSEQVQRMIKELGLLLREIAKRDYSVLLIPTMLPEDEVVCRAIMKEAGEGPFAIAATRHFNARTLMGIIGRLLALVSFRMHPVLFAAKMRTPFVALNYAPKLESLVSRIGCSKWLVDLDANWSESLRQRLDELLSADDPYCGATPVEELKQEARMGIQNAIGTLRK